MSRNKNIFRANSMNVRLKANNIKLKFSNNTLNNISKKKIEDRILDLSEDIKQYQNYLKVLGPHNKNVENLNKKIVSKLLENNHEIIQFILGKKTRTKEELLIIKTFLSTMKYLSSMISIIDTDKILFSLSIYLKMAKKNKDSVLFRYGNKGKKFYIILSGQVTILLLKETKVQMTFLRFIQHLLLLKMMKEDELIKKTIIANYQNIHHLDENTFEYFFEKIVKYEKEKYKKNKKDEEANEKEEESEESEKISEKEVKKKQSKEVLIKKKKTLQLNYLCSNFNERANTKNYKIDEDDFQFDEKKYADKRLSVSIHIPSRISLYNKAKLPSLNSLNLSNLGMPIFYKEDEAKEVLSFYIHLKEVLHNLKKIKISVNDYIRDTYIFSNYSKNIKEDKFNKKEQFTIYKYYEIVQKKKGDTFGELALQHENSKRTATIVTNTDCILGYLTKNDYETCLSEIEIKRRKNEVNFIMSFSIFDQMNWINFENKYFNYFKREYFSQGETILRQGEKINKIYFIMDGQFEITSSLSIPSLHKIIKQKTNYSYQKIQLDVKNKLYNIRLCICNNKDILGLNDCCFYGLLGEQISFVDATCISDSSIAFTLDKSILEQLQNKMSEIKENILQIINKREKVILDRLTSIYNILVKNNKDVDISDKKNNQIQNNSNKKNINYILNKSQINYILKGDKTEELYPIYKNDLLSKKFKEINHLSKNSKSKYFSSLENEKKKFNNLSQDRRIFSSYGVRINNKTQSFELSNNNPKTNDTPNLDYKKKITNIMVIKDSLPVKDNPRIFLRSAVSIRKLSEKSNLKKKMENLYLPLNKIINKEYIKLFNWIDFTKKKSESQRKANYEENEYEKSNIININERKNAEFGEDSKKLSYSIEENKKDKDIKKENENEKKQKIEKKMINKRIKDIKMRRTLTSLVIEEEKKWKNNLQNLPVKISNNMSEINNNKIINLIVNYQKGKFNKINKTKIIN
jgi:CRP-like cAMP-binding protein